MIKIICGLIKDGVNGNIKINDNLIHDLNLNNYYSKILYIDQNDFFINDTIENYIKNIIPESNLTLDEIKHLTHQLNLNINLDEKLTVVNPKLSEGERKKLQLLRLLLKMNFVDLIILDEVDAGLDIETKDIYTSIIQSLIKAKNKIIIIVQHSKEIEFEYNKKIHL